MLNGSYSPYLVATLAIATVSAKSRIFWAWSLFMPGVSARAERTLGSEMQQHIEEFMRVSREYPESKR